MSKPRKFKLMPVARGAPLNPPLRSLVARQVGMRACAPDTVLHKYLGVTRRPVARLKYPREIIVALEGGLVSSVCSHDPAFIGQRFSVIDYDIEGADTSELKMVRQKNASRGIDYSGAIVWHGIIEKATVKI